MEHKSISFYVLYMQYSIYDHFFPKAVWNRHSALGTAIFSGEGRELLLLALLSMLALCSKKVRLKPEEQWKSLS